MEFDTSTGETVVREEVAIPFENGLHARPAAILAQTASRFLGEISIRIRDHKANGKSILGLLTLGAGCGELLTIETTGPDASDAIAAIIAVFEAS